RRPNRNPSGASLRQRRTVPGPGTARCVSWTSTKSYSLKYRVAGTAKPAHPTVIMSLLGRTRTLHDANELRQAHRTEIISEVHTNTVAKVAFVTSIPPAGARDGRQSAGLTRVSCVTDSDLTMRFRTRPGT